MISREGLSKQNKPSAMQFVLLTMQSGHTAKPGGLSEMRSELFAKAAALLAKQRALLANPTDISLLRKFSLEMELALSAITHALLATSCALFAKYCEIHAKNLELSAIAF